MYKGLILIMAAGIAVRSLAPLLWSKELDPAVVVVDEAGQFAISLLSGHLGGANDLARTVAKVLGGTAVITTSTDVQGRLAVDVLARDLGVKLEPVSYLKQVNSWIAAGEQVELLAEHFLPLSREHPLWRDDCWLVRVEPGILTKPDLPTGSNKRVILTSKIFEARALFLRPPTLVVGVGCRKGVSGPVILAAVRAALAKVRRSPLSVKKLTSIEAKAGEGGISWAANQLQVDTEFFPAETLQAIVKGFPGLAVSDFVNKQMGVGGVCEPASLAGCRQGKIILGKQAGQGVTVAVAEEEFGWLDWDLATGSI